MSARLNGWIVLDLDSTILFPCAHDDRLIPVTHTNGHPSSGILPNVLSLLQTLSSQFAIVPMTSRGLDSYQRITLPGITAHHAGIAHGTALLTNGRTCPNWQSSVQGTLPDNQEILLEFLHHPELAEFRPRLVSAPEIGPVFLKLTAADFKSADELKNQIKKMTPAQNFRIVRLDLEIHLLPRTIGKEHLVRHLTENQFNGRPPTLALGDSEADWPMMKLATFAGLPDHSQLWRALDESI